MDVNNCPPDLNQEWSSPVMQETSQIQKFFKDRKVFITGSTGFLGKILVEKLLRCTQVSTVYLLIREKKGKNVHTRIDEIFEDVVFSRLSSESPKFKHKIVVVPGDCSLAGLGLSITDRQTLIKNVDIVFHAAATVNFNEQLKKAFAVNVKGTETVINLSKEMKNLKAFVHVSTAYSNCHLNFIEEKFYDSLVNYKDVEMALEKLDDGLVDAYTPQFLDKWPNTYTFTKALAEVAIRDTASNIPVGIFRPAIITSTYKEPLPGWIDNLYGPTGVCAASAAGILRAMICEKNACANIVPADTCVSAMLAVAWDVSNKKCDRSPENIPIYNYVSNCENPLTWQEYLMMNKMYCEECPISQSIWCVIIKTTSSNATYTLMKILYHYLPAVFMDALGLLGGRKPRLVKMYRKIHKFSNVLSYFCTQNWVYTNQNVKTLWSNMNELDQELFPFSLSNVHWTVYLKTYILGVRLYLLKDPVETIEKAKTRQKRFKILHSLLQFTLPVVCTSLLWGCLYRLMNWGCTANKTLT